MVKSILMNVSTIRLVTSSLLLLVLTVPVKNAGEDAGQDAAVQMQEKLPLMITYLGNEGFLIACYGDEKVRMTGIR